MRRWIRLSIAAPSGAQDDLIAGLTGAGIRGFVQEDDRVECYVERRRWTQAYRAEIAAAVRASERKHHGRGWRIATHAVADRNWNAEWERTAGIVRATPRIVIKPSWKALRAVDRGKLVLHIDPKMSFGTGHHETTRLCLRMLETQMRPGTRVLDFGTGTGVLAIAAAKLGAASVTAVDNDAWSTENALENVRRNRVARTVKVVKGSAGTLSSHRYHLAVANVDLPTITRALPRLLRSLVNGGTLILSGLLVSDIVNTLRLFRGKRVVPVMLTNEGEWISLAIRRT